MFEEYRGFRFRIYNYRPGYFAVTIFHGATVKKDMPDFATYQAARKAAMDYIDTL